MGGAIAVLSAQVDEMTRALDRARVAATVSAGSLQSLTERSEAAAGRLELLMASMHDLPERPVEPRMDHEAEAERRLRFVRRRTTREELETSP